MNSSWFLSYIKIAGLITAFHMALHWIFDAIMGEPIDLFNLFKEAAIFGVLIALLIKVLRRRRSSKEGDKETLKKEVKIDGRWVVNFLLGTLIFIIVLTLLMAIFDNLGGKEAQWIPNLKESILIGFIVMFLTRYPNSTNVAEENEKAESD